MATTVAPNTGNDGSSFELSPGAVQMIGAGVGFGILLLIAFFLFSNLKRLSHLPIGKREWTDKIRNNADEERERRIEAIVNHKKVNNNRIYPTESESMAPTQGFVASAQDGQS